MRLPPPARRYSPISVMARTFETVSRPNSRSMAARSSRSRSKISFPVVAVSKVNSVSPVIRELHINAEIAGTHQRNNFLQNVAIFAAHPHQIALNGSLHLLLGIFNQLHDFARLLNGNPLLHRDALAHGAAGRRLQRRV